MSELVSAELWRRLRELAKNAKRKHAAIAYVTDDRYVIFGKGDVLVTDASDGAIKSGQTSVEVLKAASLTTTSLLVRQISRRLRNNLLRPHLSQTSHRQSAHHGFSSEN